MYMMRFDMRAPGKSAAERAALYKAAIDMAAYADTNGCASLVISEHHASDDGYLPSPLPLAAAMASVTTSTPIVVAAALLALYDPVRLAEDMIVLDHISNGRTMFVLGLGYRPAEYELHGVDYEQRGRVVDAKLEALLALLRAASAGEPGAITPAPFSPGGPMIAWGGASKAAARRAGRNGVGFFAQTDRPGLQEAYETAAREAGHQPGMCMLPPKDTPTSVFVNDDVDSGWDEVGESLLADATSYWAWNEAAGSTEYTASLSRSNTVEELKKEHGPHRVVTVADAVDLIRTNGILQLQPLCGGLDPEIAWTYLRRVVDEVMPAAAAAP
jgi:alkanesulfonate monooxygenase SsuD/methylene tetrahydromethanopterin reductase-like flavin-dependent oxidoreductase (luciferase family)